MMPASELQRLVIGSGRFGPKLAPDRDVRASGGEAPFDFPRKSRKAARESDCQLFDRLAFGDVTARANQPLGDAYCRSPSDSKCGDEQNEKCHEAERWKLIIDQAAHQEAVELHSNQGHYVRDHEG